jgi:hypothetical protein
LTGTNTSLVLSGDYEFWSSVRPDRYSAAPTEIQKEIIGRSLGL